MPSLASLMSGGYEPDKSDDIDFNDVPDIEGEYIVEYQEDGKLQTETFIVFEGEDKGFYLKKALEFAKTTDVLTVRWDEPYYTVYVDPNTGEEVKEPAPGGLGHFYEAQEIYPIRNVGFTTIESDELPF